MKLVVKSSGEYATETSEKPQIGQGESLVKVKACGICGSDIGRIFAGKSYYYPITLGHEFSGVVEDSCDKSYIGKRVAIFPIIPCGKCKFCERRQYANCINYNYYGSRTDGGMQSYLCVKNFNLVEIPDGVSFEQAAMAEPMAVTLHAVKKAALNADDTVAVYGAGTIGLLCCMWARAMGVKNISVFDPDGQKAQFAEKLGFFYDASSQPTVVFEASGAGQAVNEALLGIRPFGRIVLIGNASRDITLSVEAYSKMLRKQLTVCGSWNSDYSCFANDWTDSLNAVKSGVMQPEKLITHRFDLADAKAALDVIKNREFFNKIMLEM